ncbi:MAG: hypothetical protein QNK24_04395 [Desulfuromusa sp.]|nr:hypothetical protein [Desulfuromusa sp.]
MDNGLCGSAKTRYAQTFATLIATPSSVSGYVTREMTVKIKVKMPLLRLKPVPSTLLAMEQNESG